MPHLFKETEDERWYLQERTTIKSKEYARVRVYRKTDRWRRVSDRWYGLHTEARKWRADFDLRMNYE